MKGYVLMDSPMSPAWSFLTGRRILDLSTLLPGPFASGLLADLGADVVKLEQRSGDPMRNGGRRFDMINRNKRSVVLDLKDERDRQAFLELVAESDAVVEGFRPGVMDRLGIGWESLRTVNPRLVMCSISGFGQHGPYANKPGHDLNFLGLSGFFAVPARPDGVVTRPGVRIGDLLGGLYAALSLAVALGSVDRTGEGQYLDVSLTDATVACLAPFVNTLPKGVPASESPLVMGDNDIFVTADDRDLVFATFEDKFWLKFRRAFVAEFPELDTEAYDDRMARTAARVEVRALLGRIFAAREFSWWAARLTEHELPWTPVHLSAGDVASDVHLVSRDLRGTGIFEDHVRFPTIFQSGLESFRSPAPSLGQHNDELLTARAPLERVADV